MVASELPTHHLLSKLPYPAFKTSLLYFIMTLRRRNPYCTSGAQIQSLDDKQSNSRSDMMHNDQLFHSVE